MGTTLFVFLCLTCGYSTFSTIQAQVPTGRIVDSGCLWVCRHVLKATWPGCFCCALCPHHSREVCSMPSFRSRHCTCEFSWGVHGGIHQPLMALKTSKTFYTTRPPAGQAPCRVRWKMEKLLMRGHTTDPLNGICTGCIHQDTFKCKR